MKWLILFSLFLFLACASNDKASNQRLSLVHTKLGTAHLENKDYPMAYRELLSAIELDPNNFIAHNNLGIAHMANGRLDEAQSHFISALKINSNYTDAKINLAGLHIINKSYHKALELLTVAARDLTYEQIDKLHAHLGAAYFHLRQFENAEKHLRKSILSNRRYCPAHRWLAPSLYFLNEFQRSVRAAEHGLAICKDENFPELTYFAGLSYHKLGNLELARGKLIELLQKHPQSDFAKEARNILNIIESI